MKRKVWKRHRKLQRHSPHDTYINPLLNLLVTCGLHDTISVASFYFISNPILTIYSFYILLFRLLPLIFLHRTLTCCSLCLQNQSLWTYQTKQLSRIQHCPYSPFRLFDSAMPSGDLPGEDHPLWFETGKHSTPSKGTEFHKSHRLRIQLLRVSKR